MNLIVYNDHTNNKNTFVNRVSNMTGEIFVNGVERDSRTFRKMSCYIMQQDELCPHLTVLEGNRFICYMKIKSSKKIRTYTNVY